MSLATVSALNSVFEFDAEKSKIEITEALGDISGFEVWGDQVLVGVYCRPVETKGRFLVGNETQIEDVWQGKVAMVLKIGPDAFTENASTFNGRKPEVGDWVYHNVNEHTMQLQLIGKGAKRGKIKSPNGEEENARAWDGWPVRLVSGRNIYGRVVAPQIVL